jgi:hypothetical protein
MAYKWKPLLPASVDLTDQRNEAVIVLTMDHYKIDREAAIAMLDNYERQCTYWRNDLYQVQRRGFFNEAFKQDMVHLNIRRVDGAAVFDWRHRQLIKNQLVGDECEAFELYPAESRMVDTSNKYHLWAFVDPTVRLPVEIGNGGRDIVEDEVKGPPGVRQRGL